MKLKKDYFEDIQLLDGTTQKVWFGILMLFLLLFPLFSNNYYLYVVNLMAVNVLVALGLNLLVGNTGQISLGHAGFVAIGAYTTVMLMKSVGVPFVPALLIGGILAAGFGALVGIPALKLEGPYLAIATLGFGLAVTVIIGRTQAFGGHMGLTVPKLAVKWTGLKYDASLYYIIMSITVLMAIIARNILKSRIGRAFQAVRDSDVAASAMGVNLARFKTLSFMISAFYAGIAGGLWALILGFINPGLFNLMMSILFLAAIVLGGLGTITGSILGAVVLTFLGLQLDNVVQIPLLGDLIQSFSETVMTPSGIPNVRWVFTGIILILIVVFEPLGLFGIWMRVKIYWKTWPF